MTNWSAAKSFVLKMPLSDKRKLYKCGDRFKTVDDLVDWSTYVKTDEAKVKLAPFLVQNDKKPSTDDHKEDDALNISTSSDENKDDDKSVTCEDTPKMEVESETLSIDEGKSDQPVVHEDTAKMEVESQTSNADKGKSEYQTAVCEDTAEGELEKARADEEKTDNQSATGEEVLSKKKKMDEDEVGATQSVIKNRFPKNDVLNGKISLFFGDITCLEIDAIVNAANDALYCGGGVDNAIHTAAGYSLLRAECEDLGGCDTGDAKITGGYKLPAKYVIHAVGPKGEYPDLLHSCYKRSMELLKEHRLETIAFPCISTGIYGYPNENAAAVVLKTIRKWLDEDEYSANVKRIIFCLFLKADIDIYHKLMPKYFPF